VSVSLSPSKGSLNADFTEDLVTTYLEMQSRALTITKVLQSEIAKGGVAELAKIKKELAAYLSSLKAALEANVAQGEALRKVEQEWDALRAHCDELKKEKEKLSKEVRDLQLTCQRSLLPMMTLSLKRFKLRWNLTRWRIVYL